MKINLICPICGAEYTAHESNLKHGRNRTCSYTCGRALAAQKLSGPKKQSDLQCGYCKKIIFLQPNQAKRRKFCSRLCSQLAQQQRIEVSCARCDKTFRLPIWQVEKSTVQYCSTTCHFPHCTIICAWCGQQKRVPPSARKLHNCCSRKCSRAWQGAQGIVGVPYARVQVTCATCGKNFERQRHAVQRNTLQYCSRVCFAEGHRLRMGGEKNPAWRGGHDPYYGPQWDRQAAAARQRDQYTCQRCRVTEETLGKTLHVHHITRLSDFDRDFLRANALWNLISLCSSCHKYLEWHETDMVAFLKTWQRQLELFKTA
jgi:5-methylcytosine-specific restriction endonuclease McrA